MQRPDHRVLARLAGAAAALGLALAGLVVVASPASAAACSGTSGVTVVVDTGSSVSTRCTSGNPSSALRALTGAGFSVTYPQQYPGSVVCRVNGFPGSDPCVRMPPGNAYWAFFHAKRGGTWVYSSSGVGSYDPAAGSVVGFRFGSGQQPRVAPPAPTRTSVPVATKATPRPKPKPTASKPRATAAARKALTPKPVAPTAVAPRTVAPSAKPQQPTTTSPPSTATTQDPRPVTGTPSATSTASASPDPAASATDASTTGPSETASELAASPVSADGDEGGSGPGTLVAGLALVALVAGGAAWAARKRRA